MKLGKTNSKSSDVSEHEFTEIGILVTAKRMGLSFEELNLFSLNDYLTYVDKYTNNDKKDVIKKASQSDIDRYLG